MNRREQQEAAAEASPAFPLGHELRAAVVFQKRDHLLRHHIALGTGRQAAHPCGGVGIVVLAPRRDEPTEEFPGRPIFSNAERRLAVKPHTKS